MLDSIVHIRRNREHIASYLFVSEYMLTPYGKACSVHSRDLLVFIVATYMYVEAMQVLDHLYKSVAISICNSDF